MHKIFKEPLVHFLLAGLLVFLLAQWRSLPQDPQSSTITIDAALIASLSRTYETQMGGAPSPQQLEQLLEDFVRDEILYREALHAGLDGGDDIVRRRMIQKMEDLNSLGASMDIPDRGEIEAYYHANPEVFLQPALVSFTHIYFNPDHDGDHKAHERALQALSLMPTLPALPHGGDRFPLQDSYSRLTLRNATQLFGTSAFTEALFTAPLQQWSGPFKSGYGWHLLFVNELRAVELPPFEAIEDQVARVYLDERQRDAAQRAFDVQKQHYRISRSN